MAQGKLRSIPSHTRTSCIPLGKFPRPPKIKKKIKKKQQQKKTLQAKY
jgi:hypothetical protein